VVSKTLRTVLFTAICVAGASLLVQPLAARDSEAERIAKSTEVLGDLVKTPDDSIPEYILDRAEAIVVIPTLVKGGFVVGAERGKGVMSVRRVEGRRWSAPGFVTMTGGSVGWQIGLQSVDLVLLVMNREGINDLLKSEFKLGVNGSVAAGPVGRSAQAATDARMAAKILAYSRAKGLFAGATIEGASLRDDRDANERFYGRPLSSEAIFAGGLSGGLPRVVSSWRDTLERAAAPARSQ
jgi:lipid-binding SYLF domain-containing protein